MELSLLIAKTVQIFFLLGPFASIPLILSASKKLSSAQATIMILRECTFAAFLCILFNHGGASFLGLLGISISALRFGGGILLIIVALETLEMLGKPSPDIAPKTNSFLVPIACPLLAGPATLFTIASFPIELRLITDLAAIFAILLSIVLLALFQRWSALNNKTLLTILEKFSGLLLIGLGTQMFLNGFWNFSASLPL